MDKKLNTPVYTRRCVDKYNKKIKEEYPEIYKERIQKVIDAQRKKNKNMRENEPDQYKAYWEKMRLYLKARCDKTLELKNSKKLNIYKYI